MLAYLIPVLLLAYGASQLSIRLQLRKLQGWWQTDDGMEDCKEALIHRFTGSGYQLSEGEKRLNFSKGKKRSVIVQLAKKDGHTQFTVIASPKSYSDAKTIPSLLHGKKVGENPNAVPVSMLVPGCVTALGVLLCLTTFFGSNAQPSSGSTPSTAAAPQQEQEPRLELLSETGERGYGYVTISGMVKNISGQPIKNVEAVAMFADEHDNFITSGEALIDYNPILAGQSSPFKAMTTDNPAIKHWKVEFKDLLGGSIPFKNSTK